MKLSWKLVAFCCFCRMATSDQQPHTQNVTNRLKFRRVKSHAVFFRRRSVTSHVTYLHSKTCTMGAHQSTAFGAGLRKTTHISIHQLISGSASSSSSSCSSAPSATASFTASELGATAVEAAWPSAPSRCSVASPGSWVNLFTGTFQVGKRKQSLAKGLQKHRNWCSHSSPIRHTYTPAESTNKQHEHASPWKEKNSRVAIIIFVSGIETPFSSWVRAWSLPSKPLVHTNSLTKKGAVEAHKSPWSVPSPCSCPPPGITCNFQCYQLDRGTHNAVSLNIALSEIMKK